MTAEPIRMISLNLPISLADRLDQAAGYRGRAQFIRKALSEALDQEPLADRQPDKDREERCVNSERSPATG